MSEGIVRRIEQANKEALDRMLAVQPVLVDVKKLSQLRPNITGRTLTHSGPPITWDRMCGAQKGAVTAACIFEGWAKDAETVEALAASGMIKFIPNHELDGVGPMGGVISPNMHVFVVEDVKTGRTAYSSIEYDSFFGAYDNEAVEELNNYNNIYYPAIKRALKEMGGLNLKPLMTQALCMGDELHSRQVAASSLFAKALSSYIVKTSSVEDASMTLAELAKNELTFLPLSMAASKVTTMAAQGVPYSTIVTTMSRNGIEFGIRVSSLDGEWYTAPSPLVDSVYFPGYNKSDAGFDIGDSAITETNGLGGFVFAAAPAITGLVNATPQQLVEYTLEMRKITVGRNPSFGIPVLGFEGTAYGIDIRKVVQTGIAPIIDTATAHKDPGHRIIGAGMTRAPLGCFEKAINAWLIKHNI